MNETAVRKSDAQTQRDLQIIANMFEPHRDDPIMRELCRLAVKCVQNRLIKSQP